MTTTKKTKAPDKKKAVPVEGSAPQQPVISGFKGFDQNMKCRDFQYKVGEVFKFDGPVKCCPGESDIRAGKGGFHFCENPLDVFRYYEPGQSVFHEVEGSGQTQKHDEDSKVACTEIRIGASLKLHDFIGASLKFLFSRKYETSTSNHIVQDSSASSATGDSSASSATGDRSASSATGDSSAAICTGRWSKAMAGKFGCIALSFYNEQEERFEMRCAETGCGDGSDGKLKAEVWYTLNDNGLFMEVA